MCGIRRDAAGSTLTVLGEVAAERARQDEKYGEQNHRNGTGYAFEHERGECRRACDAAFREEVGAWSDILLEEVYEALAEANDARLREELIQVAAVAVSWVEAIDRRRS